MASGSGCHACTPRLSEQGHPVHSSGFGESVLVGKNGESAGKGLLIVALGIGLAGCDEMGPDGECTTEQTYFTIV